MPLDYVPGPPVPLHRLDATFYGFVRAPVSRGVGTRNYLVILPLSSRSNAFARALERRVAPAAREEPHGGLDGAVALPHTEDGGSANASAARPSHGAASQRDAPPSPSLVATKRATRHLPSGSSASVSAKV